MIRLLICLLLVGCATVPITEELRITIPSVTVHIIPQGHEKLPIEIIGWAEGSGHIWLHGYENGDKISVNAWILGHEIEHMLNWADDEYKNPDE